LAPLNIPVFTGKYEEWTSFNDIYMALIHTNQSLTAIQKFFYLRSSLSNDAANCIKYLETTAANYEIAWQSLTTRYNNEKILIQTHVKNIVDLPKINEGSSVNLRKLSDDLVSNMKALETLGQKPKEWGPLLLHLLCSKLDNETLKAWEMKSVKDKLPSVTELIKFIEERFQISESVESSKYINTESSAKEKGLTKFSKNNKSKAAMSSTTFTSTDTVVCYVCNQPHTIYKCPLFTSLSARDRIDKVIKLDLCKICLRKHSGIKCYGEYCFKCNKPHNTMLHLVKKLSTQEPDEQGVNMSKGEQTATTSTTAHVSNESDNVLLGTAVVEVFGLNGERAYARVLLDSGSTNHFICSELVNSLKLNKRKTNHIDYGIGKSKQNVTATVSLRIKSRVSDYEINTQLLIVPKITGDLPTRRVTKNKVNLENITLADPSYNVPQKIDILIGARHFYEIVGAQQYKPDSNGPIYRESKFGYIISGLTSNHTNIKISCYASKVQENVDENKYENLEHLIQQFWRVEDYGQIKPYTKEEKVCEQHFEQNVSRNESGRFVVHLPFRENVSKLDKSYEIAKKRLFSIERRFQKNPTLKEEYVKFMTEYEKLGHMTQSIGKEESEVPGKMCYLAHHCVQNENSLTTKLLVFDASTKTETGVSLNDVLQKGPSIQEELIHILARFRTHNFVLTADIKKMYRQIQVCDKHRDYQQILWRENDNEPIKTYRLNTITYGTVPASYLATACLQRLSEIGQSQYPTIAPLIAHDFYIDDFISGATTKKEAIEIRNALIKLMSTAQLELGKWASNDLDIIRDGLDNNDGLVDFQETGNDLTRILGLYWDSHTDELKYKINETLSVTPLTKRNILSDIARIYDPLGLIGPVIICSKLIIQELWKECLSWSEPVSEKISSEWYKYKSQLSYLNKIKIPRQITINSQIRSLQIHGFADASARAYGCCLYLRCTDMSNNHSVKLICAKSKVAPLKILSLPRLELCAALLLAKVANKIVPKLKLPISRTYYWTDSRVGLRQRLRNGKLSLHTESGKFKKLLPHQTGFTLAVSIIRRT